jgi:hypothetical protein
MQASAVTAFLRLLDAHAGSAAPSTLALSKSRSNTRKSDDVNMALGKKAIRTSAQALA